MFVISRNSAFTYRNKPVETRQIGRELGVRYVLEGSVQRSGNQVRVNAQLIDAEAGGHLWAERFDRDIGDLFALQSEITGRIANALNLELMRAEAARPTDNPNAMDYIFKGRAAFAKGTGESAAEAIPLFERALALDPRSVEAQSRLAQALVNHGMEASPDVRDADLERAEILIEQALASSPEYPLAHFARGILLREQRRCEDAIPEFEKVLAVDRSAVGAAATLGFCKFLTGGSECRGNRAPRAGHSPQPPRPLDFDKIRRDWAYTFVLLAHRRGDPLARKGASRGLEESWPTLVPRLRLWPQRRAGPRRRRAR
jgi:tetratricopeptide (TPR) repeat protein